MELLAFGARAGLPLGKMSVDKVKREKTGALAGLAMGLMGSVIEM